MSQVDEFVAKLAEIDKALTEVYDGLDDATASASEAQLRKISGLFSDIAAMSADLHCQTDAERLDF